jgi:putative aldouronate transport system permease protein
MKNTRLIKTTLSDRVFNLIVTLALSLILLIVAYPLYFVCIASFSEPNAVNLGQVILIPKQITMLGYEQIFNDTIIWQSYLNSIIYTAIQVICCLGFTIPAAFALSRPELPGNSLIMKIFIFTMYFSGGMVPLYMVIRSLKLLNSMWALILPGAISTYNLIVARSFYMNTIPCELYEASLLDGCDYFKFFWHVAVPLSQAIVAVLALFYAAGRWNAFTDAIIYLTDQKKYPLQLVLRNILLRAQLYAMAGDELSAIEAQRAMDLMKYGLIVAASLPMMVLYPFIQKFFVSGVMIGAVKG